MFAEYLSEEIQETAARIFTIAGYDGISSELEAAFHQHARSFRDGSVLMLENDECKVVYCVLDGWLALSKTALEGQTQIIDFALPGDIFDPASADGTTSTVTIEGLTDGIVAALPYSNWERMVADWPELYRLAHRIEAAKQARRAERMLRLGKGSAEMRVAYALLEFCVRINTACSDENPAFHIPLTQQQLGDYVGLSSVHVCRTIRRLSRNGIVRMTDHMDIRVLDPHALAHLAGVETSDLKRGIVP